MAAGTRACARRARRASAQRVGESLLGIRARSDVLRTYQDYRAGLADVIQGTTYPQTRARFEAIQTLERLRASLRSGRDRASADIVLGVVLTDAASERGPAARGTARERARRLRTGGARGPDERHGQARSRGAAPRDRTDARRARPAPSGIGRADSDSATRTPATRPHPHVRKETGSEPDAAARPDRLPDAAGRARRARVRRAARRARDSATERTRGCARPSVCAGRGCALLLARPVGLVALAALVAATAAQPAVRDTDSDARCARTPSSTSPSTSAARCWRRAHRAGSYGWSARALSARVVHAALRRHSDRRRDAHEPDDAAPLPDRRCPVGDAP